MELVGLLQLRAQQLHLPLAVHTLQRRLQLRHLQGGGSAVVPYM